MPITALCLDWHIKNSDAFIDMLVDPLEPFEDIKLRPWEGESISNDLLNDPVLIFCMLPPSEAVLKLYKGKIIWLPMWDQAQGYDQDWWNHLSKNVHVVCFSNEVYKKARAAQLPLIRLRYFKDPDVFKPACWEAGKVLFYWNRTGLISPIFLEKLCQNINASELLFLGQIDPRIDNNVSYKLPSKIGPTKVTNLKLTGRIEFLRAVSRTNIFIAPRKSEGVGMTFLEAMCRGCCVLAYDAPTMNEYIQHESNGLLLRNKYPSYLDRVLHKTIPDVPSGNQFYLSNIQPWSKLANQNFELLGRRARQDHIEGFKNWQASVPTYASFILDR